MQFVDAGLMREMLIRCSQRITSASIVEILSEHSELLGYAHRAIPGNQNLLSSDEEHKSLR